MQKYTQSLPFPPRQRNGSPRGMWAAPRECWPSAPTTTTPTTHTTQYILDEPQPNTTFATPAVRHREDEAPFIKDAPPSRPLGLFSHNGPRLEPAGAAHPPRPFSYPPGEVQEDFTTPHTPSSTGIDVDRLAMVEGSNNFNNGRTGVSSHLTVPTPSSHPGGYGTQQHSSPYTPQMSSSSGGGPSGRRSRLGAIASVASNLSLEEETPQSVGTAGSGETVIRRRGFSGAVPPGFYALFPPSPQPQTPESRRILRPRRSSSAPPRPVSEGPMSPLEPGSNSPISPVSSEDGDDVASQKPSSIGRHRFSKSEELLSGTPVSRDYPEILLPLGSHPVESRDSQPGRFELQSPTHSIPRKPVSRSNAVRWNSYMSTIASESEPRSSAGPSQFLDETRRSSKAVPEEMEQPRRSSELRRSSASLDFATLNAPFPMPEPLFLDKRNPRPRVTSGNSIRIVSEAPPNKPLPAPPTLRERDSRRIGSPTSIYSREYRDSGSQTDANMHPGKRGSAMIFRESLPTWARYSHNFVNGQTQTQTPNEPIYYPPEHPVVSSDSPKEIPDVLTCPNCSVRWKPEPFPISNLNQSNFNPNAPAISSASVKGARANRGKRVYYADEPRNRYTIGRPLSSISSGSSRRHTIASLTDSFRVARNRRSGQDDAGPPRGLRPVRPPRPADRDRPISMPITPTTPATPYDPSVFVGEEVRGPRRTRDGTNWSPHLWHNRQSAIKRRTLFLAPSIDEEAEGKGLTRRNSQIWLFALGFVVPIRKLFRSLFDCLLLTRYSLDNRRSPPSSPSTAHTSRLARLRARPREDARPHRPGSVRERAMVEKHQSDYVGCWRWRHRCNCKFYCHEKPNICQACRMLDYIIKA